MEEQLILLLNILKGKGRQEKQLRQWHDRTQHKKKLMPACSNNLCWSL
jgi:hypothetical protein